MTKKTAPLTHEEAEKKIFALLGFAQKAGKVASGDDTVFFTIQKGAAQLILLAEDASQNTKEKLEQKIWGSNQEEQKTARKKRKPPIWFLFGSKQALGHAIGKSPRSMVALTDENFAKAVAAYWKDWESTKGVV